LVAANIGAIKQEESVDIKLPYMLSLNVQIALKQLSHQPVYRLTGALDIVILQRRTQYNGNRQP
jgi:hypothetical protein